MFPAFMICLHGMLYAVLFTLIGDVIPGDTAMFWYIIGLVIAIDLSSIVQGLWR